MTTRLLGAARAGTGRRLTLLSTRFRALATRRPTAGRPATVAILRLRSPWREMAIRTLHILIIQGGEHEEEDLRLGPRGLWVRGSS